MLISCIIMQLLLPLLTRTEEIPNENSTEVISNENVTEAELSENITEEILSENKTELTENKNETPSGEACYEKAKLFLIDASIIKKQEAKTYMPTCRHACLFLDCADAYRAGYHTNGVNKIWPRSREIEEIPFYVYCDMETDGGGWIVIQRRGNFSRPKDYFMKTWHDYKKGFGNIKEDFWLGNEKIFTLTNQRLYSVRFDLKDEEGEQRYALYDKFWISDEESQYKLHIEDYKGNAGDSMSVHNGMKFSAIDVSNDIEGGFCATTYKGGWWYGGCFDVNLNGLHEHGNLEKSWMGVIWKHWKGDKYSLSETEIKIRPKNFVKGDTVFPNTKCVPD